MAGTRLGSVLSLIPGLNGGNFSANALRTLDEAIYSQAYSGRNGNEPYNLGPAASRPADSIAPDSTASFWNWGSITATGASNIYLTLQGGYNATEEDDDTSNWNNSIYENQRSISVYKLTRNSGGLYDIEGIYEKTQIIERIPSTTYSWNQDGTAGETTYDYENGWYGYRSSFTKLVTNDIAQGEAGSVARLYQEWDNSGEDQYGDVMVKYIDILGDQSVIHEENLYAKIIESGDFDLRGQTGLWPATETYTSYYLQNLVSTGSQIFYLVNQSRSINTYTEDQPDASTPSSSYRTLIFSEDISVDSSFAYVGELAIPGYSNDWNWTWLADNGGSVVPFAEGALTLVNVNTINPEENDNADGGGWFTPDIYLSYFDTINQRVLSVDLDQTIGAGTYQTSSSGVFEEEYEGFDLYTIGDQSFVLHKHEDPFLNGNGGFTYKIYGTYLSTDEAGNTTLNLTSEAIKTINFSYKSLGLTSNIIRALQSAVSGGNVQGIQFPGGNMWSMAVFDKSKSSVVPKAFNAYMGFQKKLYDAIASGVQGKSDNDHYVIDNSAVNISEQEYGQGKNDKVSASCDYELDETIELLTLTGTDHYQGTGNSGKNLITGNSGNNRLDGKAGNDTILAGLGDDELIGGLGDDRLEGAGGSDTADYSDQTAAITVKLGDGTATGTGIGRDTLKSIENVITGSGRDSITCAATGSNIIAGGGNDTIIFGGKRDIVEGGEGADLFRFSNAGAASRQGTTSNRSFDQITDFTFGEDRIDLPKTLQYFGYLGAINGPISDSQLSNLWANAVIATKPGEIGFKANTLGCFEVIDSGTTRSFVAVNDGTKAYGQGDMIIEMTGFLGAASFQGAIQEQYSSTFV